MSAIFIFIFYFILFYIFFEPPQVYSIFFSYSNKKCCLFSLFRSSTDGNCLYSSIPLSLFGDDSMKEDLRILSSCELFLHNNYYCERPVFLNFAGKYNIPLSRAFKFSVSLSTLNFDLPLCELVRKEAIKNCVDKSWTSILCILALSSVCNRSICSLYPESGEKLFRVLFNSVVHPSGESITSQPNINILFCRSGITRLHKGNNNNKFQANHFVPIIPVGAGCKRKQNPVSIKTESKFASLNEWLTASQSRICFSSVSKPTISLEKLPQENITDTVPTTVKLPPFKNRNTNIEKKISIHPKLQPFTYTSLKCFKQNKKNNLDSNGILMKEKTFGKESKTPFPNFKNEKSLLIGQIENNENQNQCEKTELSPEAEIKFFRENERNDLSDGEILRKEKKIGEESKTSFSIFKSVKDVESKTLQNNELETNENQYQCEKIVELSLEIDIEKTAIHPYDLATYRAK